MIRSISARLLVASALACTCATCGAQPAAILEQIDAQTMAPHRLAALRYEAIRGERTHIPLLLEWAKDPWPRGGGKTVLHALVRLRVPEAVPLLAKTAASGRGANLRYYAACKRARLVAELAAQGIQDPIQRARATLGRFLRELGTDMDRLASRAAGPPEEPGGRDLPPTWPLERWAAAEIADMVYQGPWSAWQTCSQLGRLDVQSDPGAALKMKLAPLSPAERLAWLLDDLSHRTTAGGPDYSYVVQLAADFGVAAGRAALERVANMKEHRDVFPRTGFYALFRVVSCIGDPSLAPLLRPFADDPDKDMRDADPSWGSVAQGLPMQAAEGY